MGTPKKKQIERKVAIGLTSNDLTLLILEKSLTGDISRVRDRHLVWRKEAADLHSEQGQKELTSALIELAGIEKLQGVPIHIALSSDLCVTRVISGDNDHVRQELHELIERSSGYLSLGVGDKLTAVSEAAIDARRRHVWVTVANRAIMEALDDAFEAARLKVVRIEHSLAALSRVVQATGDDADAPVIVIDVADSGVDVGISYNGQLLLDYRPSGSNAKDSVGVIIARHTKRLQRYIDRLLRGKSPISRVCICGKTEDVGNVREQLEKLEEAGEITLRLLTPGNVPTGWDLTEEAANDSSLTADLGILLEQTAGSIANDYPNLLDPLRESRRRPILKPLLRMGWPILATIAASILVWSVTLFEAIETRIFESQLTSLEEDVERVNRLHQEAVVARSRVAHLQRIADSLEMRPWDQLIQRVGQSLPRGVWLESIQVDRAGNVTIGGTSNSEDGLFELVEHLRKVPDLWRVALESTQQNHLENGPAIQFALSASIHPVQVAARFNEGTGANIRIVWLPDDATLSNSNDKTTAERNRNPIR